MLETSLILGVDESPLRALVQGKGPALRMETAPFLLELEQSPALQYLLKRYLLCGDDGSAGANRGLEIASCDCYEADKATSYAWMMD